jgi:hypothetical protein
MTEQIPEYLGRERAKERKMMWEEGKRKQVLDGRRGRRCRMCYEEREIMEHMWNGCS